VLAVNTTVVVVVAPVDAAPLDEVHAANVRVLHTEADASPLERARAAAEQARRTTTPYLMHDADPLAWVAEAWARRFEGQGQAGDLEVAVAETLARWRARSLELPDYYLVVDPEGIRPTLRHWFLGLLASAAPARVVTSRPSIPVVANLAKLHTGRWWPDLDHILADLDHVVPEQAGQLVGAVSPAVLVEPSELVGPGEALG
jgi:hypothetical protein